MEAKEKKEKKEKGKENNNKKRDISLPCLSEINWVTRGSPAPV